MPSAEVLELHAICVANAACRLLYGQSERFSISVFETHMRLHMGTTSANATALAMRSCDDLSFAVVNVLLGSANANPCGTFMVPFEGLCLDLSPNQRNSDRAATVLLILALIVLGIFAAAFVFKCTKKRMARIEGIS